MFKCSMFKSEVPFYSFFIRKKWKCTLLLLNENSQELALIIILIQIQRLEVNQKKSPLHNVNTLFLNFRVHHLRRGTNHFIFPNLTLHRI